MQTLRLRGIQQPNFLEVLSPNSVRLLEVSPDFFDQRHLLSVFKFFYKVIISSFLLNYPSYLPHFENIIIFLSLC